MAALSLGIHGGSFSSSGAAWFGSGADYSYKSAGAVRQTDRQRDTVALGRQECQLRSCSGLFCSARSLTLFPQLIGVASLAWAAAPPICSN